MARKSKPLAFLFRGKPEDSGADRFPGCVTFEIYMGGSSHTAVMQWLNTTCPNGYRFGYAKAWRRSGIGSRSHRCNVPVLHIFDRGVAAVFKMVFAKTEHEQREYMRASRRKSV